MEIFLERHEPTNSLKKTKGHFSSLKSTIEIKTFS